MSKNVNATTRKLKFCSENGSNEGHTLTAVRWPLPGSSRFTGIQNAIWLDGSTLWTRYPLYERGIFKKRNLIGRMKWDILYCSRTFQSPTVIWPLFFENRNLIGRSRIWKPRSDWTDPIWKTPDWTFRFRNVQNAIWLDTRAHAHRYGRTHAHNWLMKSARTPIWPDTRTRRAYNNTNAKRNLIGHTRTRTPVRPDTCTQSTHEKRTHTDLAGHTHTTGIYDSRLAIYITNHRSQ